MNTRDAEEVFPANPPRTVSGRWVVVSMFLLGLIGGMICVSYAIWRNAPFLELKKALAEEFPQSVPQVEGGRHKGSPMTLRIVVNVDFHPGEEANAGLADAAIKRITALARQHQDLTPYEVLQIHLVKKRPQDTTSRKTVAVKIGELLQNSP